MDSTKGEFVTAAPIVWNDLVFVGKAGGDWGIVGEMMAFDAGDGTKVWGLPMIPTGNQPGADTWPDPAAAKTRRRLDLDELQPRSGDRHAVRAGRQSRARTSTTRVRAGAQPLHELGRRARRDARAGSGGGTSSSPTTTTTGTPAPSRCSTGADGRKLVAAAGKDGVLHVLDRGDRRARVQDAGHNAAQCRRADHARGHPLLPRHRRRRRVERRGLQPGHAASSTSMRSIGASHRFSGPRADLRAGRGLHGAEERLRHLRSRSTRRAAGPTRSMPRPARWLALSLPDADDRGGDADRRRASSSQAT